MSIKQPLYSHQTLVADINLVQDITVIAKVKRYELNVLRLHYIYLAAVSQHVIEEEDGWLTVCALSVNNTHSLLQAVAAGTAAAVPPARPHTGETAGVTPEEGEHGDWTHVHTNTHADHKKKHTRADKKRQKTTPIQAHNYKNKRGNEHKNTRRSQTPEWGLPSADKQTTHTWTHTSELTSYISCAHQLSLGLALWRRSQHCRRAHTSTPPSSSLLHNGCMPQHLHLTPHQAETMFLNG